MKWILPVFAGFLVILLLPGIWSVIYEWYFEDEFGTENYPWSSTTQAILSQRYESSQTLFQIAISVVAGVWGLLFFGQEKVTKLADTWPERIALLAATAMLVMSCYHGLQYTDDLIRLQFDAEKAPNRVSNILSPMLAAHYRGQFVSLLAAAMTLALQVVFYRWFSKNP